MGQKVGAAGALHPARAQPVNLTIDREAILDATSRAMGAVMRRTLIPILTHVHLQGQDGELEVRATDLDLQVAVRAPCDITTPGALTCSAQALFDVLRSFPSGGEVSLSLVDGRLHVMCGRSTFRLPTMRSSEFPHLPEDGLIECGPIAAEALLAAVATVQHAICRDGAKFALCGLRMVRAKDGLHCVATDGRQMALAVSACDLSDQFPPITVPQGAVEQLRRTFPTGDIQIAASDRLVRFCGSGAEMVSKVIEADYPDYMAAVGKVGEGCATLEAAQLASMLRRALVVARDTDRTARLTISAGSVAMAAYDMNIGDITDEIEAVYDGDDVRISTPAGQLIEAMDRSGAEMVDLRFGPTSPMLLIRPVAAEAPVFMIARTKLDMAQQAQAA